MTHVKIYTTNKAATLELNKNISEDKFTDYLFILNPKMKVILVCILETYRTANCTIKRKCTQNGALRIQEPTLCTYWRWMRFVKTELQSRAHILFKMRIIRNKDLLQNQQNSLSKRGCSVNSQSKWIIKLGLTVWTPPNSSFFSVQYRYAVEKPQDIRGSYINRASLHQLVFQQTGTETTETQTCMCMRLIRTHEKKKTQAA